VSPINTSAQRHKFLSPLLQQEFGGAYAKIAVPFTADRFPPAAGWQHQHETTIASRTRDLKPRFTVGLPAGQQRRERK
jgi:hypothetical protein